jgi:hypothetical protein
VVILLSIISATMALSAEFHGDRFSGEVKMAFKEDGLLLRHPSMWESSATRSRVLRPQPLAIGLAHFVSRCRRHGTAHRVYAAQAPLRQPIVSRIDYAPDEAPQRSTSIAGVLGGGRLAPLRE